MGFRIHDPFMAHSPFHPIRFDESVGSPPPPIGPNTPLSKEEMETFLRQEEPQTWYGTGLKWLGESFKPARILRPVVAGVTNLLSGEEKLPFNPSEFLNVVPFSDTLGITDPKKIVSGADLAKAWGWTSGEEHPFWSWDTAKELGADLVTDPLTYATMAAGVVPKGLAAASRVSGPAADVSRTAQLAARIPEWVPLAGRAGKWGRDVAEEALMQAGKPAMVEVGSYAGNVAKGPLTEAGKLLAEHDVVPKRFGQQVSGFRSLEELPAEVQNLAGRITDPAKQALLQDIIHGAETGQAVPLSGVARFNLPFTGGSVGMTVGTSPLGRAIAEPLLGGLASTGRLGDWMRDYGKYVPGVTGLRRLFGQRMSGGFADPLTQEMSREVQQPLRRAGEMGAKESSANFLQQMYAAAGDPALAQRLLGRDPEAVRYLGEIAEFGHATPPAWLPASAAAGVQQVYSDMRAANQAALHRLQNLGYPIEELLPRTEDLMMQFPRGATDPMGTWTEQAAGVARGPAMAHRDLDMSRLVASNLRQDPFLAGLQRGAATNTDAAAHMLANYSVPALADEINALMGRYGTLPADQLATELSRLGIGTDVWNALLVRGQPLVGIRGGLTSGKDATGLSRWLTTTPAKTIDEALDFFARNPHEDWKIDMLRKAKATADMETVHRELSMAATHLDDVRRAGVAESWVPIDSVFDKLLEGAGNKQQALQRALGHQGEVLENLLGRAVNVADYYVPKAVHESLTQLLHTQPGSLLELIPGMKLFDSLTNLFKGWQTVLWPAHHAQNFMGGVWQNLATGAGNPLGYARAAKALHGGVINGLRETTEYAKYATDELATKALIRDMYPILERTGSTTRELVGEAATSGVNRSLGLPGVTSRWQQLMGDEPWLSWQTLNPLSARGAFGHEASRFAPLRFGEGVAEASDQWNRGAHYINRIFQGSTREGAAASTMMAHLDYSMLTPFEKNVMRRLWPFYSFASLNLPQQVRQMMTTPGPTRMAIGVMNAMREGQAPEEQQAYIPEFMRTGIVLPLGGERKETEPVSGRPKALQQYLQLPSLPLEDALRWLQFKETPSGANVFSLGRTVQGLGQQMNPYLKLLYESMSGQEIGGRHAQELHADAKWFEDAYQWEKQLAKYTPAARGVSTYNRLKKLFEESKLEPWQIWSGELGGPRFRETDVTKAKLQDLTQALEQSIGGSKILGVPIEPGEVPGVEYSPQRGWYVPQEQLRGVPPGSRGETLMRAYETVHKQDLHLQALYRKIEDAEKIKEKIAADEPVTQPQIDAVLLQPGRLAEARSYEWEKENRRPGVRMHRNPYARARKLAGTSFMQEIGR